MSLQMAGLRGLVVLLTYCAMLVYTNRTDGTVVCFRVKLDGIPSWSQPSLLAVQRAGS